MDDDTDSPPDRPRPTRRVPSRKAKLKTKANPYFTRSTTDSQTSPSPSSLSAPSTDTDNRPLTRNARPVREKRKTVTTSSNTSTPAKPTKRLRVQPPAQRRPLVLACRSQAQSKGAVDHVPSNHGVPTCPWHTIPYHIWLRVFDLVAAPARDPTSRIDDFVEAVGTLVSGARVCRSITEPALAALYRCPPFHHPYKTQGAFAQFLRTLALPPAETFIHYRPKVEILRIGTESLLGKKVNGVQLQLKQVLKNLPRLAGLELYHVADDPPYRDLDSTLRYRFSKDDLLDGLRSLTQGDASSSNNTPTLFLKSWRWNSRLAPTDLTLDHLCDMHALPSFQSLRKLAYVNYQLPSTKLSPRARQSPEAQKSDVQAIAHLAASISALPNLEHLVIESSTLANGSLLERLPKTLTHLELVNCWEITSNDMSTFLMSHGSSLIYLTLRHCQSLSLGFLPVLGTSCPNLAHLEVDLSYFRHHESYADNKPEYETLLEVGEVPTWPSSIQSIEIINMRNWTREAAEMFFDSLMKNARELPNLRRLEFKVILNIEWRQRQEMRKSLANQMTEVFKRMSPPPKEWGTLGQSGGTKAENVDEIDTPKVPVRRSSRITDQSSPPVSSHKAKGVSSGRRDPTQARPVRKGLRSLKPTSSTFDADDEDSSEDELSLAHDGTRRGKSRTTTGKVVGLRGEQFIQGLCNVVDIQVDNQRPAERQYDMGDFLDDPDQSETEWNSDEDDIFD
ncbi:hypothetical protein F5Y14DRAFT_370915 [Nemania sp. NC0429]|nr:hypothetical protein F5Y14DRAFT_370915 [Nemania sp. NC0429]